MSRLGLYEQIDAAVCAALGDIAGQHAAGLDVSAAVPAKDALHGDVCVTAALRAARELGLAPRALAEHLAQALLSREMVEGAQVAGSGFVNLTLSQTALRAGLRPDALAPHKPKAARPLLCLCQNPQDNRQLWSAQAVARLAAQSGATAQFVAQPADVAPEDMEAPLARLVGPDKAFGAASPAEWAQLCQDGARLQAALGGAQEVIFFASRGAKFRPGLFEALLGQDAPDLRCKALGAMAMGPPLLPPQEQLARLYVLAHRPEAALDVTQKPYLRPDQGNPAFVMQYAASKLAGLAAASQHAGAEGPWPSEQRRLALHLAYFPQVLDLANRRAEPHRLGQFLAQVAQMLLAARQAAQKRGEKAICPAVIGACEVVFSRGFAILGASPLDEIT